MKPEKKSQSSESIHRLLLDWLPFAPASHTPRSEIQNGLRRWRRHGVGVEALMAEKSTNRARETPRPPAEISEDLMPAARARSCHVTELSDSPTRGSSRREKRHLKMTGG